MFSYFSYFLLCLALVLFHKWARRAIRDHVGPIYSIVVLVVMMTYFYLEIYPNLMKKHNIHIKTQLYISKTYKLQHLLKNLHVINNRNFRTLNLKIQLGKQHIQIQHIQNMLKSVFTSYSPKMLLGSHFW